MQTKNKIFVKRNFNCSADELFKWLVDPTLIILWFGPKHLTTVSAQNDLKVGGKYVIKLKSSSGSSFSIEGEYLEVKPPQKLFFTFRYKGLASSPPDSIVRINITTQNGSQAQLSLTQYFDIDPFDLPRRKDSWDYMLNVLDNKMTVETG